MADVKQTITGDSASAQKAYADLARQVVKLEEANQRLVKTVDQGMKQGMSSQGSMNKAVSDGITQVAALAAQWVGVSAMIAGAKRELEDYRRISKEAGGAQVTLGQAQARLAFNTLDEKTFKQAVKDVAAIKKETGFPSQAKLTDAMGNAISASGGNYDIAKQALTAAARVTRLTPEHLETVAGAGIDVALAGGVTPEEGISLVLKTGKEARVNDPKLVAKNTAQAVAKAALSSGRGANRRVAVEEAAEIQATLGLIDKDTEGDTSRTATWKLAQNLDDLFEGRMTKTIRGRTVAIKPSSDPGTMGKRLEQLAREDPRIKKHFLENMTVESYAPIVRDLIENPGGEQGKIYQSLKENINYKKEPLEWLDQTLKGSTGPLFSAEMERREEAGREDMLLGMGRDDLIEKARAVRDSALSDTRKFADMPFGFNVLKDSLATGLEDVLGKEREAPGATQGFLELRQQEILAPNSVFGNAGFGKRKYEQLNEGEKSAYDRIQRDIGTMYDIDQRLKEMESGQRDSRTGELIEKLDQLVQSNAEMNARDKQRQPSAAGAARAEAGRGRER